MTLTLNELKVVLKRAEECEAAGWKDFLKWESDGLG